MFSISCKTMYGINKRETDSFITNKPKNIALRKLKNIFIHTNNKRKRER